MTLVLMPLNNNFVLIPYATCPVRQLSWVFAWNRLPNQFLRSEAISAFFRNPRSASSLSAWDCAARQPDRYATVHPGKAGIQAQTGVLQQAQIAAQNGDPPGGAF
jgi:hypothetical protein